MTETRRERSGYTPDVPISVSPLFDWPPRPVAMARYLVIPTLLPYGLVFVLTALAAWRWATPDLETMRSFEVGWIALIWLRNAALLILVAGGLHWWLYMRRSQDQDYKYNARWMSTTNRTFLWTNQTRDNVFWSIVSGVTIWTAYEVIGHWLAATGRSPVRDWSDAPILLGAQMLLVFLWSTLHFYAVHRALHWGPLYTAAHALHHKNVNTGPWTGIAMHPIEHVLYFSGAALFWVIPSHPAVAMCFLFFSGLSPAISHSGFDQVRAAGGHAPAGDYFHHLHHRYFECNYGNRLVPLDKVFGTFHDGTQEAHDDMRARRVAAGR